MQSCSDEDDPASCNLHLWLYCDDVTYWGGSGWGCDTTPPRCTHRVRVRCCEDDTPLQVWNSLFLPHICWKHQNCCWKTTRCCLSLLLFFRKSNADCRAHRVRRCSSLYNSLTKILPNVKWGNAAPLVSFPPSHQISWAYYCYCFHQWLKLFLLIGNRFVPGAKRSRGWHLFSNHSLHRLCPSQWEKSHPHQGALKAWKEDYASAKQSVVHRLGRDWMCGRRRETWTMTFPKPVQVISFDATQNERMCLKHRMCESTKTIGGFHTKGTLRP